MHCKLCSNSPVRRLIVYLATLNVPEIKPLQSSMHCLVTSYYDNDSIKNGIIKYKDITFQLSVNGIVFRHSRAADSAVSVRIWP